MSWLSNDQSLAVKSARDHSMSENVSGDRGCQVDHAISCQDDHPDEPAIQLRLDHCVKPGIMLQADGAYLSLTLGE
jgi:hypothetical protein